MIYVLAFFILLSVFLGYLVYVNYTKAEKTSAYCEAYVRFVSALYFRFVDTRDRMKEIDRLGAFRADDEVGFIFKELDESVDDLYEFITKYINAGEDQEDEKAKD